MMEPSEIADRLEARLGDLAEAVRAGKKYIYIRFAGELAEERITIQQALTYLSWLRAGNAGTYSDFVLEEIVEEAAHDQPQPDTAAPPAATGVGYEPTNWPAAGGFLKNRNRRPGGRAR